jgi:hypothetical protein
VAETPEQRARREIDADLTAAGWIVQDKDDLDLTAGRGKNYGQLCCGARISRGFLSLYWQVRGCGVGFQRRGAVTTSQSLLQSSAIRYPAVPVIHQCLGITVITAGRHFLASDPWIKSVICPLDFRILAHNSEGLLGSRQALELFDEDNYGTRVVHISSNVV